mmetsp:Transcript_50373/g.56205  ORF Transcript_50373/g.56205 Transcript_50373/m.56205 type:complete len:117 (-) Transcript_50373:62-412(-)
MGRDGSSLRYEYLNTSNDGQYLFPYIYSEGLLRSLGVCRLNNLETGSEKVQTYKKIKTRGDFDNNLRGNVCLSSDNMLVIQYCQYRPNSIQVDYLYLNSFDFYTKTNTMKRLGYQK